MFLGVAFICIVIAILLFCKVDSNAVRDAIMLVSSKKPSLSRLRKKKEPKRVIVFFKNIITALDQMNQIGRIYYIVLTSLLLIVVGGFAGITFGNLYLSFVLGIVLAALPFVYVRIQYIEYKALLLDEMDTGLSIITSSIERTDNIIMAINENIPRIDLPLKAVLQRFVDEVSHNIPTEKAIDNMKMQVNNHIFIDWCDALKMVSKDRALKHSLRPIVNRITDVKEATIEAKNVLFEAKREVPAVMIISLFFMAFTFIILPKSLSALNVPVDISNISSVLLAIDVAMLFYCPIRAWLLTKDINFEE